MTASKNHSATDRRVKGNSSSKRKLQDFSSDQKPAPSKSHQSIKEHFTSTQDLSDSDEPPRSSSKRSKRAAQSSTNPSYSQSSQISLAQMYSFPSTKNRVNGVVDLTDSSPPTPPQSHMRTKSFSTRTVAFTPHQGPKKLVVKNLRTAPRVDPEVYFAKVWGQLDISLQAIFRNDNTPYSLEELYKGAENVCRQNRAEELHRRLREKCKTHLLTNVITQLKTKASGRSNVELLASFVEVWTTWTTQLVIIRSIFYFMDQTYLHRSNDHPQIIKMGFDLFQVNVFLDSQVRPKVLQGMVDLINRDREKLLEDDDVTLLHDSIDVMHKLGTYARDFEPVLLDSSASTFKAWREINAESVGLEHYVVECEKLLDREKTRCEVYNLDQSTREQLVALFDELFVGERLSMMCQEDSVRELFKNDKFDQTEQLYTLLERMNKGGNLGWIFDKFIIDEGSEIVFDEKRESEMVINLLDFKRRLDRFSDFSFHCNEKINNGLHKSFEKFINQIKKTQANWDTDNAKPGEMIAKHVDLLLKGGVKAILKLASSKTNNAKVEDEHDFDEAPADEDAEINTHLSQALDLFRFVHGKAVFEAFYKKDLARRLLMGRSASNDAERNMLTRLKNECGSAFTHNLESMFKDMDLARDEMNSYNQLLEDRGSKSGSVDLNVNVLSASAWPTYPDISVKIPTPIMRELSAFETHYLTKHSGRKLTWKHQLAHCQLKAKFPRGNKEIIVSGFQAIVLLLFNDLRTPDSTLSYTDIQSATNLPAAELNRTLQSLACAKYRVLTKHPKGRDVSPTDTFSYHVGFVDPKFRIKINQIQLKETKEENKETHKRVAADRHYETQAAIVRIMKSRRTIRHVELVSEVIKATQSRGVLDPADIKKNIEKLIEKDYMERAEGHTYSYVA